MPEGSRLIQASFSNRSTFPPLILVMKSLCIVVRCNTRFPDRGVQFLAGQRHPITLKRITLNRLEAIVVSNTRNNSIVNLPDCFKKNYWSRKNWSHDYENCEMEKLELYVKIEEFNIKTIFYSSTFENMLLWNIVP